MVATFGILGSLVLALGGLYCAALLFSDPTGLVPWATTVGVAITGILFLGFSKVLELLEAINTNIRVTNSYLKAEDDTKPNA